MKFEVLKKFDADKPMKVGEIVELSGRNLQALIDQRFLRPVEEGEVSAQPPAVTIPVAPKRGRGRPRKNPIPNLTSKE